LEAPVARRAFPEPPQPAVRPGRGSRKRREERLRGAVNAALARWRQPAAGAGSLQESASPGGAGHTAASLSTPGPGPRPASGPRLLAPPVPGPHPFPRRSPVAAPQPLRPVETSLGRRRRLGRERSSLAGPPMRTAQIEFRAGPLAALRRLGAWLRAGFLFAAGSLGDGLSRRGSEGRRAVRLRRTMERMGGTFVKLGQQMSIRADLLPTAYCAELGKLLDHMAPFPPSVAVAAVERATGRPLAEIFAAFDPEPIGAASIACVYQAVLASGKKVAVKVRRPGIAATFAADCRALSWIFAAAESLALVRPGLLRNFLAGMQSMFLEELDFRKEARYTEIFRRQARRSRLKGITAPRVYFDLSNDEVLVTELVSGVWLGELLWAVETGDEEALAYVASLGIEPRKVARRLFRASLFGIFDNMVFHADPHPSNVVVRRGGEVVLIDFGSCGAYTESQRRIVRQFHACQAKDDVGGMVQCALALLEPLPPVDLDALRLDTEEIFAQSLYALKSRNSDWWERTSAGIWLGFLRIARKYQVSVNLTTLRVIRSTLLYDTLAARLWGDLDIYKEYRRHRRGLARRARRRFEGKVVRLLARGVDDRTFLRWEEMLDLGQRTAYRLNRLLDAPAFQFSYLAGKAVYAASTLLDCALVSAKLGAAAIGVLAIWRLATGGAVDLDGVAREVATSGWFLAAAGVLLLVHLRRILLRFGDRET
jgi:ubiquinone biosynthesis protein